MSVLQSNRKIAAPIDDVFQVVADVRNLSHASHFLGRVEFLSKEKTGVSVKFRAPAADDQWQLEAEVKEFVENERICYRGDCQDAHCEALFTITATPKQQRKNQSELRLTLTVQPFKLFAMLRLPLIIKSVVAGLETELDTIKAYCEHA